MAGISSKALGQLENKKKFNGIEFDNDLDLNTYEAYYRNLDPQTGRWWQIDPKIESMEAWSPYASNYDNPVRYADYLGDQPDGEDPKKPGFVQGVKEGFVGVFKGIGNAVTNPVQTLKSAVSLDALKTNVLDLVTTGGYSGSRLVSNATNTIATEGAYGAGKVTGAVAAGAVIAVATDGALKGIGKVIEGAGSTTLYRAGSAAEVSDMSANGVRTMTSTVERGSYEGNKLFATSAADAAQYGKGNYGLDGVPNTIMKVKVPNGVMKTATTFEADGMKAVAIPSNQLSNIRPVGPLNYSPRPTNPFGNQGW